MKYLHMGNSAANKITQLYSYFINLNVCITHIAYNFSILAIA